MKYNYTTKIGRLSNKVLLCKTGLCKPEGGFTQAGKGLCRLERVGV